MTVTTKFSAACGLAALTLSTAAFAQAEDRYFDGVYFSGAAGTEFVEDDAPDSIQFGTNRDGNFGNTVRASTGANAFAPGFCAGAPISAANATFRGSRQTEVYAVRIGADKHLGDSPFVFGALIEGARPGARSSPPPSAAPLHPTPSGVRWTGP